MSEDRKETSGSAEKTQKSVDESDKTAAPETGEIGGPERPEPTRYGDWEKKGRCIDF